MKKLSDGFEKKQKIKTTIWLTIVLLTNIAGISALIYCIVDGNNNISWDQVGLIAVFVFIIYSLGKVNKKRKKIFSLDKYRFIPKKEYKYITIERTISDLAKSANVKPEPEFRTNADLFIRINVDFVFKDKIITASVKAVEKLSYEHLRACLAHEIAHMRYIKLFPIVLIQKTNFYVFCLMIIFVCSLKSICEHYSINHEIIFLYVFSFFLVKMIIYYAYRRSLEYLADIYAANLIGNADDLINALRFVNYYNREVLNLFYGDNNSYSSILTNHPSLNERVERLEELNRLKKIEELDS